MEHFIENILYISKNSQMQFFEQENRFIR